MNMPKKLHQVSSLPEIGPFVCWVFIISFTLSIIFGLFSTTGMLSSFLTRETAGQIVLVWSISTLLWLLVGFLIGILINKRKEKRYKQYLTSLNADTPLLVKASTSPEYNNEEQRIIKEFLNQSSPGWSFDSSVSSDPSCSSFK